MVTTPSGQRHKVKPVDNKDGTVTIRYQPEEVGLHKLDVAYNNEPIDGSPFEFYVSPSTSGQVYAYGPGECYVSPSTSGQVYAHGPGEQPASGRSVFAYM